MVLTEWERQRQRDEAAPDSDKLAAAAHGERLEMFLERTRCTHDLAVHAYWINHDQKGDGGETYCRGCAGDEAAKRDDEDGWKPGDDDDGWSIMGGYDVEHGPSSCDGCGRTLIYVIDDSHAEDEINHFTEHHVEQIALPSDVHALHELAAWAANLGASRIDEIERVAQILDRVDMDAFERDMPAAAASEKARTEEAYRRERERERQRDVLWEARQEAERIAWEADEQLKREALPASDL